MVYMETARSTAQQMEAQLAELHEALYTDEGWLQLEDPNYRYTKRSYGGWNVDFSGLRLGWVVNTQSDGWCAYVPTNTFTAKMVGWGCTSRKDATYELATFLAGKHSEFNARQFIQGRVEMEALLG